MEYIFSALHLTIRIWDQLPKTLIAKNNCHTRIRPDLFEYGIPLDKYPFGR